MKYREYKNIREGIYSGTLSCGMRVYVIPKKAYNKNQALIAVRFGGSDTKFKDNGKWYEVPEGMAHFMEHKMFENETGDAMNIFTSRGASANAYTGNDMTAYYFESPDMFEENLKTLIELVTKPYFTEESVEREKGIIAQEIGMVEDTPDYRVYKNLMDALYKNHCAKNSIAGTVESISKISSNLLYKCHSTFYTPNNMVLCVVGNYDPDLVFKIAEEAMSSKKSYLEKRDYGKDESEFPYKMSVVEEMDISESIFLAGAKVVVPESGEEHARTIMVADVAMEILFGRSSPLYLQAYEEGIINGPLTFDLCVNSDACHMEFGGEGKNPEAFMKKFFDYMYDLVYSGVSDEIVKKAKKNILGNMIRNLDSFDDICDEQSRGVFLDYCLFDFFGIVESISKDEIRQFIEENLSQEKIALSIIKEKTITTDKASEDAL